MRRALHSLTVSGIRGRLAVSLHRTLVIVACIVSLLTGCSKTADRQLHETPCGAGKLVLELRVIAHSPAPSEVKFSLALVAEGRRRVVDVLKPRAMLWGRPDSSERFTRLRPGPDNWPVFVNPRDFTPSEYEQVRERLQATCGEFDGAAAQSRTGVSADYGADLQLSSIRYVDYESFRRSYFGSQPGVTVAIYPDGGIWLHHPGGASLLGGVVDGGRKVVLGSANARLPIAGVPDPVAYLLAAVDGRGRRIADEFAVEKLSPAECEAAMAKERAERAK